MTTSGKYSKNAIQAAAAWDLFNPWAKYYQLFSTHPLPAKRIMRLNEQCESYGLKPEIDFSGARKIKEEQAGKSMLDEFLLDVTIKNLPTIVFAAMGIVTILWIFGLVGFIGLTVLPTLITLKWLVLLWFVTFYLMGFAVILRTGFMYKKGHDPQTVLDLVTNVKVSPIRCVPAYIEGSFDAQPRGIKTLKKYPVEVYIGRPMDFSGKFTGSDKADLYQDISDEIMRRIAALKYKTDHTTRWKNSTQS